MNKKSAGIIASIAQSIDPSDLGTAAYKNTGTNSGDVPILDSNGKLNISTIPAVAITDVYTAASEQAMLALDAEKGDVCIRTDENKTYILANTPASTLSNWVQVSSTGAVVSVNNKTGVVTLDADDVGAVSSNTAITGNTKCKITYDSKGLVTAGADLQTSDIPDLSSSYVSKNADIAGSTKCKITYDSKGLVTSGADLQASDIPDLSSSYVAKNSAITGATKCKITYDSKGLVTSGADLQASDIPDISANYVATNSAITSATKCKVTYDSKGLVTAGADLQTSDIPDLSSTYVAKNTAITGETKCKITYDSKGLVTSGENLSASDLPSHSHAASDITSGILPFANGGTGSATSAGAAANLRLIDTGEREFGGADEAAYISNVQSFFTTNNVTYVPYAYNADWTNNGDGAAIGISTKANDTDRYLFVFNEDIGIKFYHQSDKYSFAWRDYSPTGVVLYENSSGSNSSIQLSESAANFNRMMIYCRHNDGEHGSLEINSPNGKAALLSTIKYRNDNVTYITSSLINISGTSITWTSDNGYNRLKSQPEITFNKVAYMYITKVVGYRY